jgi:kumamolisin
MARGGAGVGVSDISPVSNYQEGKVPRSINPGQFAGRAIPDVAANADSNTGYLTMSGAQLDIVGGTSASAPLWASLITRINELLGGTRWQLQRAALQQDRAGHDVARHYQRQQ